MSSIDDKMRMLRTRAEVIFYTFSVFLTKEQAELATTTCLEISLKRELEVAEDWLRDNKKIWENLKNKNNRTPNKYDEGALIAYEGRSLSHQREIDEIKDLLVLIKLL